MSILWTIAADSMSQVNIFEAQQMACLMGEYSECGRPATEKDATTNESMGAGGTCRQYKEAFGKTIHVFNEVDLTVFRSGTPSWLHG